MTQRDLFASDNHRAPVLSVSELTAEIKELLETSFVNVWVEGEISNFTRASSGHCYFTLKDKNAQLPAIIWRSAAARLRFRPGDGLEVVCRGQIDLYPPRGRYQLIVKEIQPKGIGALELALRQLRDKLAREGLFDPGQKRPIPEFVHRVAVVTSPTGAAVRDFVEVLRRRWRGVDVWVVPVRVQGDGSAEEIAQAVEMVNRLSVPCDCLVVTRGGGSLEDLWAFNEEIVVRSIFASRIPVISAVGHEIDVTLSDLVADVRALTPSEAAELVAPSAEELAGRLRQCRGRMDAAVRSRFRAAKARLDDVAARRVFSRPLERVTELARRVDELELRGNLATANRMERARGKLKSIAAQLESLSPLGVLARGYSLTEDASAGQIIHDASELSEGQELLTRFGKGRAISRVQSVNPKVSRDKEIQARNASE